MAKPESQFVSMIREVIAYSIDHEKKHYDESIQENKAELSNKHFMENLSSNKHKVLDRKELEFKAEEISKNHIYVKLLKLRNFLDSHTIYTYRRKVKCKP